jgi:hypothetical protein
MVKNERNIAAFSGETGFPGSPLGEFSRLPRLRYVFSHYMAWSDTDSGFFFLWKKKKPLQKEKPPASRQRYCTSMCAPNWPILGPRVLGSEGSLILPHPVRQGRRKVVATMDGHCDDMGA